MVDTITTSAVATTTTTKTTSTALPFDINDLDLDTEEFNLNDIELPQAQAPLPSSSPSIVVNTNLQNNEPTLESILNEKDDDDDEFELTNNDALESNIDKISVNSKTSSTNTTTTSLSASFKQQQQQSNLNSNICKQTHLKQISSQLCDAIERSNAGLPTSIAISQLLLAVGTSRGLILIFDLRQAIKFYLKTDKYADAVSALSFNNTSTRILVGTVKGYIFMYDITSNANGGKQIRFINDAHPIDNAILHLKFTDDTKLAVFSDSGGSVFTLEFTRTLSARRTYSSQCLFSGSRGEVCCLEPLKFEKFYEILNEKQRLFNKSNHTNDNKDTNFDKINQLFKKCSIIAMASFTKLFIITLRPDLNVLYTVQLTGSPRCLPILNWQFAIIQSNQSYKLICPILAYARESTINFLQIEYYQKQHQTSTFDNKYDDKDLPLKFKFIHIQKNDYSFKIYNFCWLNAKTIAILDSSERLHVTDVKTNEELQLINLDHVQLVYNNSSFKSLATGGYVSKAFALAGENACYQTFISYNNQLYLLGTRNIYIYQLQLWSIRIDDYINENQFEKALDLALDMFENRIKGLIGLPIDVKQRKERIMDKLIDVLYLYINYTLKNCNENDRLIAIIYKYLCSKCINLCISMNRDDLLFDSIYNVLITQQPSIEGYFYESLEKPIIDRRLKHIPASILKSFIEHYIEQNLYKNLEMCILSLNESITEIDLDQIIRICRKYKLYDAFIYIYNHILRDFETPFNELLELLDPVRYLTNSDETENGDSIVYGNKFLVYLCSCLCGHSYNGNDNPNAINETLIDSVRSKTFEYLISKHNSLIESLIEFKSNGDSDEVGVSLNEYPLLIILMNFNCVDFFNILSILFQDETFESVIGLDKKQQLIDILIDILINKRNNNIKKSLANKQLNCFYIFLAKQLCNKKNNIKIDSDVFKKVINYLCYIDNHVDFVNNLIDFDEREQLFLNLVNIIHISSLSSNAINEITITSGLNLYEFSLDNLINLALNAKFFNVLEYLYELNGQYYEIIDCYLNQNFNNNTNNKKENIFLIIKNILNILYEKNTSQRQVGSRKSQTLVMLKTAGERDQQLKLLKEKLFKPYILKQLIKINAQETAFLLWIEMNIDLKEVIKAIKSIDADEQQQQQIVHTNQSSKQQLQTSVSANELEVEEYSFYDDTSKKPSKKTYDDTISVSSVQSIQSIDSLLVNVIDSTNDHILYEFMSGLFKLIDIIKSNRQFIYYISHLSNEYIELYINLMCVYDSDNVVRYLRSISGEYALRLDECLRICRDRRCWDAVAYLHEKSGQIEAAFNIYLDKLKQKIKNLEFKLNDIHVNVQKMNKNILTNELIDIKANINSMLNIIIELIQQNDYLLVIEREKEKTWFSLFDEIMSQIANLTTLATNLELKKENTLQAIINDDTKFNLIEFINNDLKVFFKSLGKHIINSMIGYININLIIDKLISQNKIYNIKCYGDIKELIFKMFDIYSYERILLSKTFKLVSNDVYKNMLVYNKYKTKAYTANGNYCQYCFKLYNDVSVLDLKIQNVENDEEDEQARIDRDNKNDLTPTVTIFHCGHLYHTICFNSIKGDLTTCPICNPARSQSNSKTNLIIKQKYANESINKYQSLNLTIATQASSNSTSPFNLSNASTDGLINENSTVFTRDKITFTQEQINTLKAIRTRNLKSFRFEDEINNEENNYDNDTIALMLNPNRAKILNFPGSQLALAPANITKFV